MDFVSPLPIIDIFFQAIISHSYLHVQHLVLGHGHRRRRVQPRHGLVPQGALLLRLLLRRRSHHGRGVVRYLGEEKKFKVNV